MTDPVNQVREDFDAIARLQEHAPANPPYLPYLLRQLPASCGDALEIGCGTGDFTRHLASRASRVVALDLSPEMIRVARTRVPAGANVEFVLADASTWAMPEGAFDVIACLNTLHHLSLPAIVPRMRQALRPGGTLLLLDVLDRAALGYLPLNALAAAYRSLFRPAVPPELRRAYAAHGRGDRYLTPAQARSRFARLLPGARFRHHLLWRYSVVWTRPPVAPGEPASRGHGAGWRIPCAPPGPVPPEA